MEKKATSQPGRPGSQHQFYRRQDTGLRGCSQCLSCQNTASRFPDSQFPTRQPHSPGGGLPVGELGPDPRAVLMDQPDVNGQHNRCSVGQMGVAQRMDRMGTGHPARTLSSQLGCGIMQGHIWQHHRPRADGQGLSLHDHCSGARLRQAAAI